MDAVAANQTPFTSAGQTYDWQASWRPGQISFRLMKRYPFDTRSAFILPGRDQSNVFFLGDPKAVLPKGAATGIPVVSGAGQTGYRLVPRGCVTEHHFDSASLDLNQFGYPPRVTWLEDGSNHQAEPPLRSKAPSNSDCRQPAERKLLMERRLLGEQLKALSVSDLNFELEVTGFKTAEIEVLIDKLQTVGEPDPDDLLPVI